MKILIFLGQFGLSQVLVQISGIIGPIEICLTILETSLSGATALQQLQKYPHPHQQGDTVSICTYI